MPEKDLVTPSAYEDRWVFLSDHLVLQYSPTKELKDADGNPTDAKFSRTDSHDEHGDYFTMDDLPEVELLLRSLEEFKERTRTIIGGVSA